VLKISELKKLFISEVSSLWSVQNGSPSVSHFLQTNIITNCELRILLFFPITWTHYSFETEELYTLHFNFCSTQSTIVSAEESIDSTEQWWKKYLRFVNHVWVGGGAGFLTVLHVKSRVSRLPPSPSKTSYLFAFLVHHNSSVTPALDCRRVWCVLKRSGNVRQSVIGLFLCYVRKQTRNINEVRNNLRLTQS
jgi:hypothetical protein